MFTAEKCADVGRIVAKMNMLEKLINHVHSNVREVIKGHRNSETVKI